MDQVADYATDCFDAHEHLNPSGARKVSDYLGRYVTEHYDGNALFENEKLMTLMQNIAREHVFEEDLFAKWSNSLFPLERLDEAAQSGQSYAAGINRAAGEITETVGADVPEGVHITLSDPISGETVCEKQF